MGMRYERDVKCHLYAAAGAYSRGERVYKRDLARFVQAYNRYAETKRGKSWNSITYEVAFDWMERYLGGK